MDDTTSINQAGLRVIERLKEFLSAPSTVEQFRTTPDGP